MTNHIPQNRHPQVEEVRSGLDNRSTLSAAVFSSGRLGMDFPQITGYQAM